MRTALSAVALLLTIVAGAAAQDSTWPREIDTERGIVTVYQPQPETFEGNLLTGRAALSLTKKSGKEPTFGVMWFRCRVDTNWDEGMATMRDFVVTDPDGHRFTLGRGEEKLREVAVGASDWAAN